jgi:hypothetical protein
MVSNRNLQRAARARQAATGENYTTALRHVHGEWEAQRISREEAASGTLNGTVREWFAEALDDVLSPTHAKVVTDTVLLDFRERPRSRQRETTELCSLLDHAYSAWCGEAVLATGRNGMEQGLQSVNVIFEPWDAAYVLAQIREYAKLIAEEPVAELLPVDSQQANDAAQADEDALRILAVFEETLADVAEHARRDVTELADDVLQAAARGCAQVMALAIEADAVADVEADATELRDRLGSSGGRRRARPLLGDRSRRG